MWRGGLASLGELVQNAARRSHGLGLPTRNSNRSAASSRPYRNNHLPQAVEQRSLTLAERTQIKSSHLPPADIGLSSQVDQVLENRPTRCGGANTPQGVKASYLSQGDV